jgi:signal transduction histidine kinase
VTVVASIAQLWLGFARGSAVHGLPAVTWNDVLAEMPFLVSPVVGAVIVSRQPRNAIGWLFCASGFLNVTSNLAGEYAFTGLLPGHPRLPAYSLAAWLSYWIWVPGNFTVPFVLLLFPDGRFLTPRWRCAGLATLAAVTFAAVTSMFVVDPTGRLPLANPLGITALAPVVPVITVVLNVIGPTLVLLGIISFGLRYRRSSRDVRQQMKWVMFAFALLPISFLLGSIAPGGFGASPNMLSTIRDVVLFVTQVSIAVAIGIAMLKYHLYDIDVVISRTLVYGALALFITAVYVGIVVGVGTLVGSGGRPNLFLSIVATALVAVAFQPVRERLQKLANRLVYGKRATPYEVLAEFSARVAESYAGDQVLPRMAQVLADGTGAERARVWLRVGNSLTAAAAWPDGVGASHEKELLVPGGQLLPDLPDCDRAAPVRHQGELLGALSVKKRTGEALTPVEEKLLDDLARQAGLVLKNVGLTTDLQARLEELRGSRQRLVAAQDQERRRLERNLHDGAQQHLVAIKVRLGLAEMLAVKDPAKLKQTLAQLVADTDEALNTLRELARGIYPPLLADRGLVAALVAQVTRASIPVTVVAEGLGRYSQEVEAAVYFCCLEALQNIQKYARATSAQVSFSATAIEVRFEVRDDGSGFDPATASRGSGLQNMEDRLNALGGSLEVRSRPGHGAAVTGTVPAAIAVGSKRLVAATT